MLYNWIEISHKNMTIQSGPESFFRSPNQPDAKREVAEKTQKSEEKLSASRASKFANMREAEKADTDADAKKLHDISAEIDADQGLINIEQLPANFQRLLNQRVSEEIRKSVLQRLSALTRNEIGQITLLTIEYPELPSGVYEGRITLRYPQLEVTRYWEWRWQTERDGQQDTSTPAGRKRTEESREKGVLAERGRNTLLAVESLVKDIRACRR